jgi:putative nucleotidyltransferase with HDIG domain
VRILYRVRQFWDELFRKIDPQDLEQAHRLLTEAQFKLFIQLQPGENSHALKMVSKLQAQGETRPDLLSAALLHDIGKLRYRLNPVERVMVVLAQAIIPRQSQSWGNPPTIAWEKIPGWRKSFIVAAQHAEWGAEMVRVAGASPLTVELIRHHHSPPGHIDTNMENSLQQKLWLVDNES